MANLGGRTRNGGRKRGAKYQKLYRKGEGSSFELKDKDGKGTGSWRGVVTYTDTSGIRKRKYFSAPSERAVREKMAKWSDAHGPLLRGLWSVTDLFEHLLAEKSPDNPDGGQFEQEKRQRPNTIFDYRSQWRRHVKPLIGHKKLSEVTTPDLDYILTRLQNDPDRPLSPRSILNVRRMIMICFKEGERLGYIIRNPAPNMRPIKIPKYRASIYSGEAVQKLIRATEGQPVQLAIMLAGVCGLREGEIAGLMRSDFDKTTGTLQIVRQVRQVRGGGIEVGLPKTDAGVRTIKVTPAVAEALSRGPVTSPYYFPSPKDPSQPMHPTRLYKQAQAAMEAAGLPRIRFHNLRHSANNVLKQLGVQATVRRDILGHSTIAVTENIYTQTVTAEMVDAMDAVARAFEKQPDDAISKAECAE